MRIEVLMLKIWHYLNYDSNFYLCDQSKMHAFLFYFYGHFWKFQEVLQSCKMLRLLFTKGREGGQKFYQQKTILLGCTKIVIDQQLLAAASSNLVGGKQRC